MTNTDGQVSITVSTENDTLRAESSGVEIDLPISRITEGTDPSRCADQAA
jgi:hypothetical protein